MSRESLHQEFREDHAKIPEEMLSAALGYAERGILVFPIHNLDEKGRCSCGGRPKCKPGKHPRIEGGHTRATTDKMQIRLWWTKWPDANIAAPTGIRSGFWILDEDTDKGGTESLEALLAEHGRLPRTRTAGTGGGGRHWSFRFNEGTAIRNSAGRIGPGLDVRGEGGYVLLPPSRTAGPYEWIDEGPAADAPAWLEEAARRQAPKKNGAAEPHHPGSVPAESGPIPYGARNHTLASILGRAHDGTRTLAELVALGEEVNRTRCEPPIGLHPTDTDPDEVASIAVAIHRREPCRRTAPKASPETAEEIRRIEVAHLWGLRWKGKAGKVARSAFATLVLLAREYGTLIPAGVRVSVAERDFALAASLSKKAVRAAIATLRQEMGILRRDNYGRSPGESGAFVLLAPEAVSEEARANSTHSTRTGMPLWVSGNSLRAPRLRCSSPGSGKRLRGTVSGTSKVRESPAPEQRDPVIRLDKGSEEVLDWLDAVGGRMALEDLVEVVGARLRDLRSRVISKLEAAGVVEVSESSVVLVPDWLRRLDDARELADEFGARERDKARYEDERRNRWKPEKEPERLADAPQEEEPMIGSVAEVLALAHASLGVIPPKHREEAPYPPPEKGTDPLVHRHTAQARFFQGVRERDLEKRKLEGLPPWIRLVSWEA